jgi:hypothetical protein
MEFGERAEEGILAKQYFCERNDYPVGGRFFHSRPRPLNATRTKTRMSDAKPIG